MVGIMGKQFMRKALLTSITVLVATATPIFAQDALESRLGALLGQERQALSQVPDDLSLIHI